MSNAEQAGSAIVGAAIGFALGGPTGLTYGFQIGLIAGQALFPVQLPKQFGPRLEDINTTVAVLGEPVAITYGTFSVPGQVIALGCVVETERTEHVGGKGGPEQTVVNFTYTQTIGVGLCEGPICGILRVWENGELKYDIREQQPEEDSETYAARIESSGLYALTFTLYLGDETQEADPDLEIVYGDGMVPGFRGIAYVVYPDRLLSTEQALRHPQWRFEVTRGAGERGVTSPTLLDGPLDGFSVNVLVPDWTHNKYFAMDNSGGSSGWEAEGIRAFSLRDNTEFLQRSYFDIGMVEPIAIYQATVGMDGFLYVCTGVSNDDGYIYKLDPTTLDIVLEEPISLFSNQWDNAITTRITVPPTVGEAQTLDFLISASLLGNKIITRRCDTLGAMDTISDGREEARVLRGPTITDSHGLPQSRIYVMTYDEAGSGTTDPIEIRRIKCGATINIDLSISPTVESESIGFISCADLKADWVRIQEITGVAFDAGNDAIVFCAKGSPSTGAGSTEDFIFKIDPETLDTDPLEFFWKVEDTLGFAQTFDKNHNLSRLAGGEWVAASSSGSLLRLDLDTGVVTEEDWTDLLPGNQTFTGEEIWDDITGCLLTFISDVGPVLICDSSCSDETVTLGEIVADICDRSGVPAGGYDVEELIQTVHGFGIMRNMPGRQAIETLRPIAPFDAVESGMQIKFPVRGRASSKTYVSDELGAFEEAGAGPPDVTTEKKQSVELPRILRVHYLAPSRDYEQGEKLSPSRFSPGVENEVDVDLPVALDDSQALQIAEIMQADAWAGRWSHETAWDVSQLAREPTDVVLLPIDSRLYRCRIAEISDTAGGLLRKVKLVRDDDGAYVSDAVSAPPMIPGTGGPRVVSDSSLLLLDLPPLQEEDDDAGIYGAVYRTFSDRSWPGAVAARSQDGGATWAQIAAISTEATVGTLSEAVGSGSPHVWDLANELIVELESGSLETREESAVINGANALAIGAHGRWEIVQFLNAELIDATTYRLSGLLRGRRGTEPFIGSSEAGDMVVLISDGSIVRLPLQSSDIGQEYRYRATTIGLAAGVSVTQDFTGAGRALLPWAPVMIEGERAGADLTISFSRRSRLGSDLTPSGDNLPLTDEPEAYEIDILDGVDVVRTIDTAVESASYTEAEQITDFGSAQALISVRIYQISAIVGRGLAGEAQI